MTMPALFFMAYKVGALIIDVPVQAMKFELSFHWLSQPGQYLAALSCSAA